MPATAQERDLLHTQVLQTIQDFKQTDPKMETLFETAYGYAVIPTVTKGGAGIGGAHGQGEVFEQGELVGYCDMSQGTIGFQLGGQTYSEVIFFNNKAVLESFKTGKFAFDAQVSAIAASAGAAESANYERGVLVFTLPKAGLMYEASVGGQKFGYIPIASVK